MGKKPKTAKKQPPEADLLRQIKAFCLATNTGLAAWGDRVFKNPGFISKLEEGRKIRPITREKAEAALAADWRKIADAAPPGLFGPPSGPAAPA